ncbi:basic secretory protein-like protein [Rhodopirellula bahusiensis]|uniref:basic secretory protein-like protein n=1 Tax=Rhodopirellula bahusiensis TaxID=2014065 RepID=UPI003266A22C
MQRHLRRFIAFACLGVSLSSSHFRNDVGAADVVVQVNAQKRAEAKSNWKGDGMEPVSKDDAGNQASIRILSGRADQNGASVEALRDGVLPDQEDQPSGNFFFSGSSPSQLLFDFGHPIQLEKVRSYSWHPSTRAAQVYSLYAPSPSDGTDNMISAGAIGSQALNNNWRLLGQVDTRTDFADAAQVAVEIAKSGGGELASTRYVLMTIEPTGNRFGQTFYSEIDFLDGHSYPPAADSTPAPMLEDLVIDGKYTLHFDFTEVPALENWVKQDLIPACELWYPRIVQQLASEDFEPPTEFTIQFDADMRGVAFTRGKDVFGAGSWYLANLEGEATGSIVHELVHVVQQYPRRRGNRPPGWLVEGIADHIRWYQYEPTEKRRRINWERSSYDDAYFASATFLDAIVQFIDPDAVSKVNAACRQGRYTEEYWVKQYGKSPSEIWKFAREKANGTEKAEG